MDSFDLVFSCFVNSKNPISSTKPKTNKKQKKYFEVTEKRVTKKVFKSKLSLKKEGINK